MVPLKKIVILGPESTGKTTLCQQLAAHYQTLWCPEFAREYLLTHGKDYTFEDLLVIAKGQIAGEAAYTDSVGKLPAEQKKQHLLFLDTDMYVMKVWCEFVFGDCHSLILDEAASRTYDLYLLCKPDLPWVHDELREYPDVHRRDRLYNMYKDILVNQSKPWVKVTGENEQRLQAAIAAVEGIINYEL